MSQVLEGYREIASRHARRLQRVWTRPSHERQARLLMRALGAPEAGDIRVPRAAGWVRFNASQLGLSRQILRLAELGRSWIADEPRWIHQSSWPRVLTRSEDFINHPEILEVALHRQILQACGTYLGQVPRLNNLMMWWSPPNETLQKSQLFHYDHRDTRQAKLFINLLPVGEQTGPLYFLDIVQSRKFNRTAGYSQKRIADEKVSPLFNQSDLHSNIGPAGTGLIVDTARCLHYGSRGNSEGRLVLTASFTRVNCLDPGRGSAALDPVRNTLANRYAADPVRTFVLTSPL